MVDLFIGKVIISVTCGRETRGEGRRRCSLFRTCTVRTGTLAGFFEHMTNASTVEKLQNRFLR